MLPGVLIFLVRLSGTISFFPRWTEKVRDSYLISYLFLSYLIPNKFIILTLTPLPSSFGVLMMHTIVIATAHDARHPRRLLLSFLLHYYVCCTWPLVRIWGSYNATVHTLARRWASVEGLQWHGGSWFFSHPMSTIGVVLALALVQGVVGSHSGPLECAPVCGLTTLVVRFPLLFPFVSLGTWLLATWTWKTLGCLLSLALLLASAFPF